jgi:hypothetical protein
MKRYIFACFITLFLASCAVPREQTIALSTATLTSVPAISTNIPSTPTPQKAFVPKQNDLIFIEFFAVT